MIDHCLAVWNNIPLVHGSITQLQSWIYYGAFVLVSTLCGYKKEVSKSLKTAAMWSERVLDS